jgi:hypothetical protein
MRGHYVIGVFGQDDADRLNLVTAGIGAVQHPRHLIKTHVTIECLQKLSSQKIRVEIKLAL